MVSPATSAYRGLSANDGFQGPRSPSDYSHNNASGYQNTYQNSGYSSSGFVEPIAHASPPSTQSHGTRTIFSLFQLCFFFLCLFQL